MAAESNYLSEATAILNAVKDHAYTQRPSYQHPYILLTALLTHAPSESGRKEIAKDIVDNAANEDGIFNGLIRLTNYFWTSLLVPCIRFYVLAD
jgi:hypothetical protein